MKSKKKWSYVYLPIFSPPSVDSNFYDDLYVEMFRRSQQGKCVELPGLVMFQLTSGLQVFIRDDYIDGRFT